MSKAAKRASRDRLREERRRQQERQRRMRRLAIVLGAVGVVVVVVLAGVFVQLQRTTPSAFEGKLPQITKLDNGTVRMVSGQAGKNVPTLHIYEDFQCPICQRFEQSVGGTIKKLASDGKVKVVYHPVAIIDKRSVRAGSAALAAAEHDKFMVYHDKLFEKQPPEVPKQGFTTEQLINYGEKVGLTSDSFAKAVKQQKYKQAILTNTKEASQRKGFKGTPTIYLNGKQLPLRVAASKSGLKEAIQQASKSGKGNKTGGSSVAPSSDQTPSTPAASGSESAKAKK